MVAHDPRRERIFHPEVGELEQEAFTQIACCGAGWIKALHPLQYALDVGERNLELRCEFLEWSVQVAVVIEVVDDRARDPLVGFAQVRHTKLPEQMVLEARTAQRSIFKRAAMVVIAVSGR